MKIKVLSVTYQRNGVCGLGHHNVMFTWQDDTGHTRRMIGYVFGEDTEAYGVIDIDDPTAAWRGDHFVDALRRAIADAGDSVHANSWQGLAFDELARPSA